jgi:hypothetical protein
MYSFSIVRLRGSTWAFGFDEILVGSVTATGVGRVWAAVSAATVLMMITIANRTHRRMTRNLKGGTSKIKSRKLN